MIFFLFTICVSLKDLCLDCHRAFKIVITVNCIKMFYTFTPHPHICFMLLVSQFTSFSILYFLLFNLFQSGLPLISPQKLFSLKSSVSFLILIANDFLKINNFLEKSLRFTAKLSRIYRVPIQPLTLYIQSPLFYILHHSVTFIKIVKTMVLRYFPFP